MKRVVNGCAAYLFRGLIGVIALAGGASAALGGYALNSPHDSSRVDRGPFVWRGGYAFKSLDDSSGPLKTPYNVAINNSGEVMVEWARDDFNESIMLYNGTVSRAVAVADSGGSTPYIAVAYGCLNNVGQVGFDGVPNPATANQIVRDTSGAKQLIAQYTDPNDAFGTGTTINDSGVMAFRQKIAGVRTIQRTDGTTSTTIVQAGLNTVQSTEDPTINNAGQVAYYAQFTDGHFGIYRGDGTTTTTIADNTGPIKSVPDTPPALNDLGHVAMAAELDAGGAAVYIGDGITLTKIADTTGPFSDFSRPAINDLDEVAFIATLDAGGIQGIYTGPDPVADKVITVGDSLFGSTVQQLNLYNDSLNDAGQIAFLYHLSDGRIGVAVASLPEPTLMFAVLLPVALLVRRRRTA